MYVLWVYVIEEDLVVISILWTAGGSTTRPSPTPPSCGCVGGVTSILVDNLKI